MYDELTPVDIQKMNEEIEYRKITLRPQLIDEVKTARGFGDLSENFEYKVAKREKNKNESRIRYLERMVKTAKLITASSEAGVAGLFNWVTLWFEEEEEEQRIQLVTTLRQDSLNGFISKESPVGKAVMGHRVGDRVLVQVNPTVSYPLVIRAIEPGEDNTDLEISGY